MIYIILGFTAMILLQIYLSKKDNRIVGLIQPVSLFVTVLVLVLSAKSDADANGIQKLAQMGYALLYFNIPTIVLFIIYLVYQKPFKLRESDRKQNTYKEMTGKPVKNKKSTYWQGTNKKKKTTR